MRRPLRRMLVSTQVLACGLLLLAGALADLFGPQPYTGLPLLAAAPLLAGALLPFGTAATVAVLACVVSVLLDLFLRESTVATLVDVSDVGAIGLMALVVNTMLRRQRRRLVRAIDVAEAAQRAILPAPPEKAGPLRVAARYESALAEARIGGDLYAVQPTRFGVRALIGDVRGKGLAAVGTVSVAIGAFRQEAEHTPTIAGLAQRLDDALCRESERRASPTGAEDFTTAVLAEFSPDAAQVRLVNLGHPSPCLVHDGAVRRLDPSDWWLPLGMRLPSGAAGEVPPTRTVPLPPGAFLLLFTDGVVEARNAEGTFYDPCAGALASRVYRDPGELVDALVDDVYRWTGGRHEDDMAVVAFAHGTG